MTNSNDYFGEGWYTIGYSDGGQSFTNEGAIWVENKADFDDFLASAKSTETEYHQVCVEYHGCEVLPSENLNAETADENWVAVDPYYLSDKANDLMCELVYCKNYCLNEEMQEVIDALKALK